MDMFFAAFHQEDPWRMRRSAKVLDHGYTCFTMKKLQQVESSCSMKSMSKCPLNDTATLLQSI